jgi:hypothetical protein
VIGDAQTTLHSVTLFTVDHSLLVFPTLPRFITFRHSTMTATLLLPQHSQAEEQVNTEFNNMFASSILTEMTVSFGIQ